MKEEGLDEAKLILEINSECDRLWGGLKHGNLSIYIDKVVEMCEEKGLKAAVVVVLGMHPARLEDVKRMLKDKKFLTPTEIRIDFLDGSGLKCQFGKKDSAQNY